MTIEELRALCAESLQRALNHPEWANGEVMLKIPRQWISQRRFKLFMLKGAPYGEPIYETHDGTLVIFNAQEILDFLDKSEEVYDGSA